MPRLPMLDGGRVVETGNHAGLLDAGGRYAAMWAAQTRARRWTLTPAGAAE